MGSETPLDFCAGGGYLVGPDQTVSDDFNWGRGGTGCGQLVCGECGQAVRNSASQLSRTYRCDCAHWRADRLESMEESYPVGPADLPVEKPPWKCAGHPRRSEPGSLTEKERALLSGGEPRELARAWERAYHPYAQVPRGSEVLRLVERGPAEAQLIFLTWNPGIEQARALPELVASLQDSSLAALATRGLVNLLRAADDPRALEQLRAQATRPGWVEPALPHLSKAWLREHAAEIVAAQPEAAKALCSRAARADVGWDPQALRTLPLEVLRAGAATMPRSRLRVGELHPYWERDCDWLVRNLAALCSEASDFYFYFEEFLLERDWEPDSEVLELWHEQAMDEEHSYNALPPLIRFEREWVVENLGEILDRSGTRGVWLVDELRQSGLDIRPLLPVLEARDPKDLRSHLPLWFPE